MEDPAVAGGWAACGPMGVLNVDDAGAGADDADDADADAVTNAVASALGSKTFANISVIRFIQVVPCMPLTATAVVSFSFCAREGGAMISLAFDPRERFFRGDVGGRGLDTEGLEGSEDGVVDSIDGGGTDPEVVGMEVVLVFIES